MMATGIAPEDPYRWLKVKLNVYIYADAQTYNQVSYSTGEISEENVDIATESKH